MKRFSQRLFGKGGQRASGGGSSAKKSDAQLQSESKRIVRFQGVALVFLSKVRDDVHSGQAASNVELVVAEEDLSDAVKAGATIRRDGANPDGSFFGEVAYVDGTLNNIAQVYKAQGKYDEALRYYVEALEIKREQLGDRHPSVATTLNDIARVYDAQGKYDEALRYFEEALEIYREKLGDRHPFVATTLNNIGWVHRAREEWSAALAFFEEAFGIRLE
ncbi:Kinesin light chain (KLC), partial [Durusdinium trenchii]